MEQLFNRQGEPRKSNGYHLNKPIHRRNRPCVRCGGAGRCEKWRHTGLVCYRCNGGCIDPVQETEKLYTAERLEKLNATKAKADARRAAERAEKERLEKIRQAEEREALHEKYVFFIDRLQAAMGLTSLEIISDVHHRLVDLVQEPSDKQIEACNKIMDRIDADKEKAAKATHIGEIKERRLFENLTLLYTSSTLWDRYPSFWSHWSLFETEDGQKVACKSAPWVLGLERDPKTDEYTRGQKISVKATIVDHLFDKKNLPITYINRPKAA